VARIARAFGMELVAYDPPADGDAFRELQARQVVELDELLAVSDWVTLHVPLVETTRGMIGARELEKMKPNACLINCARGAVVDEHALHEALVARKIAGAALDVFASEPCTDSPLFKLENVVATPHLGATSAEAQLNVAIDASNALLDYFKTGDASKAVNARNL
jgi:D-3-phosphoglycerate dehydrogenase